MQRDSQTWKIRKDRKMARKRRAPWIPPGVFCLWKPVGPTSHDLVDFVRKLVPRRAKVGHTGTLDPFAEGALPICVGGATRLADWIGVQKKTYRATLDLSQDTDTGDCTGETLQQYECPQGLTLDSMHEVALGFLGRIEQTPPAYSAIRVNGERAYVRARRGEKVEMPSRQVTLYSLEILSVSWPLVDFRVQCSRGTYVRTLGQDLGRKIGVGGHLKTLVREAVGDLDRSHSFTPFELVGCDPLEKAFVPIEKVLNQGQKVLLPAEEAERILRGNAIPFTQESLSVDESLETPSLVLYKEAEPHPIAIGTLSAERELRPVKVFGCQE